MGKKGKGGPAKGQKARAREVRDIGKEKEELVAKSTARREKKEAKRRRSNPTLELRLGFIHTKKGAEFRPVPEINPEKNVPGSTYADMMRQRIERHPRKEISRLYAGRSFEGKPVVHTIENYVAGTEIVVGRVESKQVEQLVKKTGREGLAAHVLALTRPQHRIVFAGNGPEQKNPLYDIVDRLTRNHLKLSVDGKGQLSVQQKSALPTAVIPYGWGVDTDHINWLDCDYSSSGGSLKPTLGGLQQGRIRLALGAAFDPDHPNYEQMAKAGHQYAVPVIDIRMKK